jgi:hypothetical protein
VVLCREEFQIREQSVRSTEMRIRRSWLEWPQDGKLCRVAPDSQLCREIHLRQLRDALEKQLLRQPIDLLALRCKPEKTWHPRIRLD